MDTKWKNLIEKGVAFWGDKWISVPGLILTVLGVFGFVIQIVYRGSYSTETVLGFGMLLNLCLWCGISLLLRQYLDRKYRNWGDGQEFGFAEWKAGEAASMKRLCKIFVLFVLAAVWYLSGLVTGVKTWGGGWYSYYNYATGYILVFTVLVQFLAAWGRLRKFWYGKLAVVFGQMDVHLQKRLAEALEIERSSLEKVSRSDQLRVDLITNVSHDLKTPLTSMVGYIELIKKEELSDVVRDYMDVVSARTEKLKEMINSLFSLAKASSGNVELKKEWFEVNRLIGQIFADMDDQVKESGIEFVMQLSGEDTKIFSDNSYFYRICQNLIENTLKYSAAGTRVFVRTFQKVGTDRIVDSAQMDGQEKRSLYIEITNTAKYLMDFTKDDIVERFARGEQARTSDGNGLGLAIVSAYAKALGGEFDIRIDCDQFKACLKFEV